MTASRDRGRRTRVELPRERVESFRAGVEGGGVPGATLVYGWITQAARYAREGRFELVPAASSAPPSTGPQDLIYYSMSADESAEVRTALRDAGSSVRAVVSACVAAYEDAGHSTVRMVWPRRERLLAA